MFTLKEIACEFGLNLNTLRYWLKKNSRDFESEFYDVNLLDYTQKIKIRKKTLSVKNIQRSYEQTMILDLEEFRKEFTKYVDYVENTKRKKRIGNLSWTNSAIECYTNNMSCEKCYNCEFCCSITSKDGIPPMKNTVKKLLSEIGKPYLKF